MSPATSMSSGGFEFELYKTWFGPGVMQSAAGAPTFVSCVGRVDVTLGVNHNRIHRPEHSVCGSFRAPRLDEYALVVEFCDARIAHSIGDKNIARRIPGDIGRPVEDI